MFLAAREHLHFTSIELNRQTSLSPVWFLVFADPDARPQDFQAAFREQAPQVAYACWTGGCSGMKSAGHRLEITHKKKRLVNCNQP